MVVRFLAQTAIAEPYFDHVSDGTKRSSGIRKCDRFGALNATDVFGTPSSTSPLRRADLSDRNNGCFSPHQIVPSHRDGQPCTVGAEGWSGNSVRACPSLLTAYRAAMPPLYPMGMSNNATGEPLEDCAPVVTGAAITFPLAHRTNNSQPSLLHRGSSPPAFDTCHLPPTDGNAVANTSYRLSSLD